MADAPAVAAGMPPSPQPQVPLGPPLDEPGFPVLPMFRSDTAEWINATTPARLAMGALQLRDGLSASTMGMLCDGGGMGSAGLTYATRFGALKAEVISQGVLQTTLEGFMPLPFMQLTTQLAFMPQGLAGGAMQSVVMCPIGAMMMSANLAGQLSAEIVTGLQPFGETSQVLVGAHVWGLPGAYGGSKYAIEYIQGVSAGPGEPPSRVGTITAEVTRPHAGSSTAPSGSLSVAQTLGGGNALNAAFEVTPQGERLLSMGGSKQLSPCARLRGRVATNGLLSLALQLETPSSQLTLQSEIDTSINSTRAPKFGATVQLSG